MMQDPKKKEVGEMGKPSLKAKFEAAMQKKFDSDNKKKLPKDNSESLTRMVKNVREEKDQDSEKFNDWYKKEAIREALSRGPKEKLTRFVKDVREDVAPDILKKDIYKKPLKSMSKEPLKKLKSF
jgi:ferritin